MAPIKVLFVCIHNSARSQMAQALLETIGGDRFQVESAGIEPGTLNPLAVAAMKAVGIDISRNRTKSVFELLARGLKLDYVVTVCDETQAERCPIFPGPAQRLHWGFADPSTFEGSWEENLAKTCLVRGQIEATIRQWLITLP
jgi:arsenate reductase